MQKKFAPQQQYVENIGTLLDIDPDTFYGLPGIVCTRYIVYRSFQYIPGLSHVLFYADVLLLFWGILGINRSWARRSFSFAVAVAEGEESTFVPHAPLTTFGAVSRNVCIALRNHKCSPFFSR